MKSDNEAVLTRGFVLVATVDYGNIDKYDILWNNYK